MVQTAAIDCAQPPGCSNDSDSNGSWDEVDRKEGIANLDSSAGSLSAGVSAQSIEK
jgi:hypothetical protein